MKYAKILLVFLSSILFCQKSLCDSQKAFVSVPIADLTGDYLNGYRFNRLHLNGLHLDKNNLDIKKNNKYQTYETLPLESKKGTSNCKRINQALFNEIVEIISEKDNQVQVKTLNTFYQNQNPETKLITNQSIYWAKKDNFILFEDLEKAYLDKNLIPKAIKYSSKNIEKANKNTVTLKLPFYDKVTNKTYSAGTRFVKTGKTQTKKYIQVFIFDPANGNSKLYTFKKTEIPLELCANHSKNKNNLTSKNANKLKREEFLEILKNWANIKNGFIPYVWGGSSYTQVCNKNKIAFDPEFKVYTRPEFNLAANREFATREFATPGLDCSGLVARAAQICNIPYFYKNTLTARNNLTKIASLKDLKNGDLIIYNGHIIVVSDIKNNKIIEARTNEHGCGRVHEVVLSDVFYNIKTYQDLFNLRDTNLRDPKNILERIDTVGDREKILAFDFYSLI
ncbi:MAG: hypothetical protein UR12_C0029G0006 [candidate division TM6 bacterium GW2011_GWF2_30_66]|nr:MAG: hypothetical protein UR12_C0029G0006 [candidate division TM6 bacterium GW2011_GWF2_30_66]